MPPAATLDVAAGQASSDLMTKYQADTLQVDMIAFAAAATAIFPTDIPNNVPLADWCSVISAFAPSILPFSQAAQTGVNSLAKYQIAVDYVYRICIFAFLYETSLGLITPAQSAALLAAYNANFA